MGFFENLANDLAMGFGAKPKTKDFEARTARTIARNEGFNDVSQSRRATDYMAQRGVTQADIGNMSASTAPGYTSLRDRFDGGGMGMSGARFSRGNVSNFDTDGDKYISEQEYIAAEKNFPNQYRTAVMGGIPSLSNRLGARPLDSYAQERNLFQNTGVPGTNIGTSGIADYLTGGGFIGNIVRGGRPGRKMRANPLMEQDARLTPDAVAAAEENPPPRTGPLSFLYNNAPTANNVVESLAPKIRPFDYIDVDGVPVLRADEGPLKVKGPGLSDPVLSYPKDSFGNVVLDPLDMQVNDFARGGIVSLVRR